MAQQVTLGYWDIRGYAEPIRTLLHYLNVPFKDVRYGFGSGDKFPTNEEWMKEKFTLDLPFPNLPYLLIDGHCKFTQSVAILKYFARKHGLVADNPKDQTLEDMIEGAVTDTRYNLIVAIYYKTYENEAAFQAEMKEVLNGFIAALGNFEKWIGEKKWLVTDKLSYVDFMAYEYFDWYREFVSADCFSAFPKMAAYMKRFEELPSVKAYLTSDGHKKASC
ncbi:PREDICTED: glutathione S-transferase Mu 1-like, partial [Rhagoletis zephyria]|uniref:glutathione S-transferase Mu 1-like n=1 Tax=Rhagoletis zephyria TaxID=28612 RepID=UPI00081120B3